MTGLTAGVLACAVALACASCSSRSAGAGFAGGSSDASAPADALTPRDVAPPPGDDGPTLGDDGGDTDPGDGGIAVVYGQSFDTLYKLDPLTKVASVVGMFQGCGGVTDIALDKDSNMYGTTFDGVYTIDPATAACTLLASGTDYPNSLSFVPAGTVDPKVEALVGYNGDQYVRIDTMTGALSNIGTTIGMGFSSSGDIVSVIGGGTYLTVTGPGCPTDCLLQVDPSSGAFLKNWGPTGYSNVFGIAFWAGAVYGFDVKGDLFEVQFTGINLQVTAIPIPNAPSMLSFEGAGSTTSAPPQATM